MSKAHPDYSPQDQDDENPFLFGDEEKQRLFDRMERFQINKDAFDPRNLLPEAEDLTKTGLTDEMLPIEPENLQIVRNYADTHLQALANHYPELANAVSRAASNSYEDYLLSYFTYTVFFDELEFRPDNFLEFKKECINYENVVTDDIHLTEPIYIRLQRLLQRELPREIQLELLGKLNRSFNVELTRHIYEDGSSPSRERFFTGNARMFPTYVPGEKSPKRLQKREIDQLKNASPIKVDKKRGYIIATPSQVSRERLFFEEIWEDEEGTNPPIPIRLGEIAEFFIQDARPELNELRVRELVEDRPISVWRDDLINPRNPEEAGGWVNAKISKRGRSGDTIELKLDRPVLTYNSIGIPVRKRNLSLWVGSAYGRKNQLVPPEHSLFEQYPDKFPHVALDFERKKHPYEGRPDYLLPNNLVRFADGSIARNGKIWGKTEMELLNYDGTYGDLLIDYSLEGAPIPETLEPLESSYTGQQIRILPSQIANLAEFATNGMTEIQDYLNINNGEGNDFILQVAGVFSIEGQEKVVLEALPSPIGTHANFLPSHFFEIPIDQFEDIKLISRRPIYPTDISEGIDRSSLTLQQVQSFWNRKLGEKAFGEMMENLNDEGVCRCKIQLQGNSEWLECAVDFKSFHHGLWVVIERGQPVFYEPEEIVGLKYDHDFLKRVFNTVGIRY